VRYYLISEIPSGEDGDFSIEKFESRYNGNLANGLGNFTARTIVLATHMTDSGKSIIEDLLKVNVPSLITQKIERTKNEVSGKIDEFKLHEALAAIWELISYGDKYINENKPWEKDPNEANNEQVIYNVLHILEEIATLLIPFLPDTSEKILSAIEHKSDNTITTKKIDALFPRV